MSCFNCPSLPCLLPRHTSPVLPLCPDFCLVMLQLSSLFVLSCFNCPPSLPSFASSCFNCPLSLPCLLPCHASTVLPLCPVFCLVILQLSSLFALSFTLSCFNCPPSLPCLPVTKLATYHHDLVQAKRKKECCMGPPQKGILTAVTGLYMVTGTAF